MDLGRIVVTRESSWAGCSRRRSRRRRGHYGAGSHEQGIFAEERGRRPGREIERAVAGGAYLRQGSCAG